MTAVATGLLAISIDLEPKPLGLSERRPSLDDFSRRLMAAVAQSRFPMTWVLSEPATSPAAERLVALDAGHEIAVLGDASWVGEQVSRASFHRELYRRVGDARAKGIEVSTLVLRDTPLGDHVDLAIKNGVTTLSGVAGLGGVAPRRPRDTGHGGASPQLVRFGLWAIPATDRLPSAGHWAWLAGGRIRRGIDRAISAGGVYHLAIEAAPLAAQGSSALRSVERILRHVQRRLAEGKLAVTTLASLGRSMASRATPERQGKAAQSILRPAA